MGQLAPESVDLVVTSPPYPMVAMWDECFSRQDRTVRLALKDREGWKAFERMHLLLDAVWDEVCRVLAPGRFACINIGDAVRQTGGEFGLFPNHARIIQAMSVRGMTPLPCILWRKQTNAPNKFMGSGMLPAGAYVTLEHEYILIFRKGGKRAFTTETDRLARRESAVFWEERNNWFSDVWFDLKGARQELAGNSARKRSGAYPFELAYRLVNMYSVAGDRVLDPFAGTGTTVLAAMASGRSSTAFEIEADFESILPESRAHAEDIVRFANGRIRQRIDSHLSFVEERIRAGKPPKYVNNAYGFPVVTRQETDLLFRPLADVRPGPEGCTVYYADSSCSGIDGEALTAKAPQQMRLPLAGKRRTK